MNSNENDKADNIIIDKVANEELMEVFPLFVQLCPTAKESVFKEHCEKAEKFDKYNLYKATLNKNNRRLCVGLIGYVFNEYLCAGRTMYIDILVVDKNYRKKGIGKQLMDFAVFKLHQDKNARFLRWTTRNDLTEAVSFYRNQITAPAGYYYRINNPNFTAPLICARPQKT
ncbi:MAG: GNAT family N-acetyltransferase [Holosporales bacterium]|jgi:ribosomal protein S18 acetylase RimI-like enzyme|nr:GNAT family N-acetyltransferase [Holosporales bacterium]